MKRAIRSILLLFFTMVLVFSLWRLWGIFEGYRDGQQRYETLEQYVSFKETAAETESETHMYTVPEETWNSAEQIDLTQWPQVDFDQLSQINSELVGWIYIPGTNVNYPVVQGADNDYYLNRMFDKSRNGAGSIFLDANCHPDFSGKNNVIYGHHMKDGSMFADLVKYKEQSFFEEHSAAYLVTPSAYYKIQFFSGYVSDTWSDAWDLSFNEYEYLSWLNSLQKRSFFTTDTVPTQEDRVVTLSTCTYEFETAKFVLHGYISDVIENTDLSK